MEPRARGRCLCGAVAYEVRGPLRDVMLCHCVECRRWGGYVGAYTATEAEHLVVEDDTTVRWLESPASDRHARRAFCERCGSSLFWVPEDTGRIHVAAGTLEAPTGIRVVGHWYTHQAGDYGELGPDGLPRDGEVEWTELRWT